MPEPDPFNLNRFVEAQSAAVMAAVQQELKAGRKQSHWMWFIFPQLRELGRSATAEFYGIGSLAEAVAYRQHPILSPSLIACTGLVNAIGGRSAHQVFGSPDDLKFRSCMTLFSLVDPAPSPFTEALSRFYDGPDPETLRLTGGARR